MFKTLLVLGGALVISAGSLHAQHARSFAAHGSSLAAARPAAYRGGYNHGGYNHGGYGHGHRGRYYYLGGIPYFYPFGFYGGFGYPYYYGAYGFGDEYGYGGYPAGGAYNGTIADGNDGGQPADGGSLPEAVQRQLVKRGYYKGTVDGQFGPASRSALARFQKKQGLKETGRIDEPTLDALGFTDRH